MTIRPLAGLCISALLDLDRPSTVDAIHGWIQQRETYKQSSVRDALHYYSASANHLKAVKLGKEPPLLFHKVPEARPNQWRLYDAGANWAEFERTVSSIRPNHPGKDLPEKPQVQCVLTKVFIRNPYVVATVLERAGGYCESCGGPAPFQKASDGTPYLEVHHRITLAQGGPDTVENAVALCPNCHRKAHFGAAQK